MLKTQIVIAIDPGTTESAYVGWDGRKILFFNKCKNLDLLSMVRSYDRGGDLIIEEINPYSMGKAIRDTIFWSGRFYEAWVSKDIGYCATLLPRNDVREHLCGSQSSKKIKDRAIIQALVDRFAYGQKNFGKGTKKEPGFFYGFKKDVWQSFALAVTWWDKKYSLEDF